MENKANTIYNSLNDEQKKICEVMFKGITQKQWIEKDVSRPASIEELAEIAGVSPEQCREVAQLFSKTNEIIVTTEDGMLQLGSAQYMQDWALLQSWMQTEGRMAREYLKWVEAADKHQSDEQYLLMDCDLKLALAIREEYKPNKTWGIRYHPEYERTMAFLDFSKESSEADLKMCLKLVERRKQIFRAIFAFICFTMFGSLVASFFAYENKMEAEKNNVILQQMLKQQRQKIDSLTKIATPTIKIDRNRVEKRSK